MLGDDLKYLFWTLLKICRYARNFFIPPSVFGIGSASPVLPLRDAFSSIPSRDTLALVRNGFIGGDIDRVVAQLGDTARSVGKSVSVLEKEEDLLTVCRSSLRGTSRCLAAVIFNSSPSEGEGGRWNYTFRADGSLGSKLVVNRNDNDQQLFVIPLQHSIDYAIARLNSTVDEGALPDVLQYPYTSISQAERVVLIRTRYNDALISLLAVAFFIGVCGILYQQVGAQATERESGMSPLLEVMMPNTRRWEPQVARLISYHVAFTILYIPGWIAMAIILQRGVFARTSMGIVLVLHILTGLSLASTSLFIAAFFKKAQLSGITAIIISLLLAVLAQVLPTWNNAGIAVCSLLFPSMNYTFFTIYMARWERLDMGTSLTKAAPESPTSLPGIVLWIFLVVQIIVYPVLAAIVERALWGTTSGGRKLLSGDSNAAVELTNFSKHFRPSFFEQHIFPLFGKKSKETVVAVDDMSLSILPGQLTVLLGANGSGKSTTLDAIAGLSQLTHGTISLDFRNGLGLCPQKNVLWKELTSYEHVDIFNRLKSVGKPASKEEKVDLLCDCDLTRKINAFAGSLSGGQMRKLQLSIMFTGGSRLCLIDECSSGIDPIARRKVQNILLAERSRSNRTMIFTSHYLDEADIADKICIMSKGKLRANGTAPEIKSSGVYRVFLYHTPETTAAPPFEGYDRQEKPFETIYTVSTSADAADLLSKIEDQGIWKEYQISGPTVEDAFMKVAEEMNDLSNKDESPQKELSSDEKVSDEGSEKELQLQSGTEIGPLRQGIVLFRKRITVFRRNYLPNTVAFLIIPIAAGLVSLFLKNYAGAGCRREEQISQSRVDSIESRLRNSIQLVVGPARKLGPQSLQLFASSIGPGASNGSSSANITGLLSSITLVDTIDQFNANISERYANFTPGGFFLGDGGAATFAYRGNGVMALPFLTQNLMDTLLSNISISAQYRNFDIPWQADQGSTLQFAVYFGLALSVYPAFFALYPCLERLQRVRGLHYSNGVRALALWQAYILFDFLFILLGSAVAIIILRSMSSVFFGLGYLFLVFILYGLTSTILAYIISLFAKSQLAAFAIAAAYQDISLLLYMIAYLSTLTYGMLLSNPPSDSAD